MKLLSVALPAHDANAAVYDGQRVRYVKFERTRQQKRFHFDSPAGWRRETEQLFGIDVDEFDEVAFSFDPSALPPPVARRLTPESLARLASGRSLAEPLDPVVCAFLRVRSGWLLSHHFCHALSGWMCEAQPAELRIIIDGLGDGRPWSVYRGEKAVAIGDIRRGSIGWGIREAGKLLGVQAGHFNDIAGKVMGLQSHGQVDSGYLARLRQLGIERIGEIWSIEGWTRWRGDPLIARLTLLDWVATVHERTAELLIEFFGAHARPDEPITYSGGVAQNVLWNARLRERFPGLMVAPHCSDEGLSLGGLDWLRRRHQLPVLEMPGFPYAQHDVGVAAPTEATLDLAARLLADGRVIGWYQGQGEIGPRALGNRSILIDPRLPDARARIDRIKNREPYRPYGASVLAERFGAHFSGVADPFMLYACRVTDPSLAAVTHRDGSSRVQTVDGRNPVFRALLERFDALTGCPVLLNTSLNVAGKPLAARPEDAAQLFFDSPIDAVFVGDDLYRK